jgi:D-alanyl-lipoteichoic acid acyltransferase DltB (MBOAT superfamily)
VQILVTFVLVYFAWIFFRANNTHDAFTIIGDMFKPSIGPVNLFTFSVDFYIAFVSIFLLLVLEYFEEYHQLSERIRQNVSRPLKWAMLAGALIILLVLSVWEESDFLYFQF